MSKEDDVFNRIFLYIEDHLTEKLARVNGMLSNERFMSKAPESKVAEERAKLEKYSQMMDQVKERLTHLQAR